MVTTRRNDYFRKRKKNRKQRRERERKREAMPTNNENRLSLFRFEIQVAKKRASRAIRFVTRSLLVTYETAQTRKCIYPYVQRRGTCVRGEKMEGGERDAYVCSFVNQMGSVSCWQYELVRSIVAKSLTVPVMSTRTYYEFYLRCLCRWLLPLFAGLLLSLSLSFVSVPFPFAHTRTDVYTSKYT